MRNILGVICNDVMLIVYRELHRASYVRVVREVEHVFGSLWHDKRERFELHSYVVANYRTISDHAVIYSRIRVVAKYIKHAEEPWCWIFEHGAQFNRRCGIVPDNYLPRELNNH